MTAQIWFEHMGNRKECIDTYNCTRKERKEKSIWQRCRIHPPMMMKQYSISMYPYWSHLPEVSICVFTIFLVWSSLCRLNAGGQQHSPWLVNLEDGTFLAMIMSNVVSLKVDLPSLDILQIWTKRMRPRNFYFILHGIHQVSPWLRNYPPFLSSI